MRIAVDFDGTVCCNSFEHPYIGYPDHAFIRYLMFLQECGHKLILWTCREGESLQMAVDYCRDLGLIFDAVNDNLPEVIENRGFNSRKIVADMYIDDKSIHPEQVKLFGG